MINEEKKELLFRTILAVVLLIGVIALGIFFIFYLKDNDNNQEKEKIPVIKENYVSSSLNLIKSYNGRVYIKNDIIYLESISDGIESYIIGKKGILDSALTPNYKENQKLSYNNYEIGFKDNYYYYIDRKNNIVSDSYNSIAAIKIDNKYSYFILHKDKEFSILNIDTNEIKVLDDSIKNVYYKSDTDSLNVNIINNNKYLVVSDYNNKYGIIDYDGNIIVECSYDYLSTYKSDTTFIAKLNNKYGIINDKNKVINEFKYDNIFYYTSLENYSIFLKDKSLLVYYNDSEITKNSIKYNFNDDAGIRHILNDEILYLNIATSENESEKSYILDKDGIKFEVNDTYEAINDENEKLKYFYKIENINNQSKITYYDLNYNNIYSIYVPYVNSDFNIISVELINDNVSKIIYPSSNSKTYYVDLSNLKQLDEKEAINKYFDNGYSFTLNDNNKLTIYKNNDVISTFDDINDYLGGYYFLKYNDDDLSEIYMLKFK